MQIQIIKGNKELRLIPQNRLSPSIIKMIRWELNLHEPWQLVFSVSPFTNNYYLDGKKQRSRIELIMYFINS